MPDHQIVIECLLNVQAKFLLALLISGSVSLYLENVLCIISHLLKLMAVFVVFLQPVRL